MSIEIPHYGQESLCFGEISEEILELHFVE